MKSALKLQENSNTIYHLNTYFSAIGARFWGMLKTVIAQHVLDVALQDGAIILQSRWLPYASH